VALAAHAEGRRRGPLQMEEARWAGLFAVMLALASVRA
jgi:hypothetical protein